ncbi:MAG: nuclease-related domain-containing protein [Phycisphaerales bacterium JB050]
MIVKVREPSRSSDPRIKAGEDAELQMAHYLKRAFGEDPETLVFNDLRLCRYGEIAQIDHLVLHRWGLIVIESKSITGQIDVNDHLEFTYRNGRNIYGMPSPVEQAKRQRDLLMRLLKENSPQLREPHRQKDGFTHCPSVVRVAIADQGVINRGKIDPPELMKADQVPGHARMLIRYTIQSMKDRKLVPWELSRAELMRVCCFLLDQHTPLVPSQTSSSRAKLRPTKPKRHSATTSKPASSAVIRPANLPVFLCTHCHSQNVSVKYAYSYYLACADCSKNTPLKLDCPTCKAVAKPRKRGKEFFAECVNCNEWRLVFVAK